MGKFLSFLKCSDRIIRITLIGAILTIGESAHAEPVAVESPSVSTSVTTGENIPTLNTMYVTANKKSRSEKLQDVPTAISAFTGEFPTSKLLRILYQKE